MFFTTYLVTAELFVVKKVNSFLGWWKGGQQVISNLLATCQIFQEHYNGAHDRDIIMSPQGHTQQGTGSGSKLESYVVGAHNADVVASALSSVHMHLRALGTLL